MESWKKLRFILSLFFLSQTVFASSELFIRGHILHFLEDPKRVGIENSYQYLDDGLLVIKDGKISGLGNWKDLSKSIPKNATVSYYPQGLILPGFIDSHIHFTQLDMIAANSGGNLKQWLLTYTYPFEKKFKNVEYAKDVANALLDELIRNGTTTAMIYGSIFPDAVDALFIAAEQRNMRIISGKVMADTNIPAEILQSPAQAAAQTIELIQKWNNKPGTRLLYALTFGFAYSTSPELFQKMEQIKQKYPDIYVHTHIGETSQEYQISKQLFKAKEYLDIYDRYHLLGRRTLLAHGIYLTDEEEKRLHATGTSLAFCPTSNLFLGSGLFNFDKAHANGVTIGLGTDVGAGTSLSLLQTLNEAYKVLILQNQTLSAFEGFYLATLGSAHALDLQDKLGNFAINKEADFIVLDFSGATKLLKRRLTFAKTLGDKLFVLMILADDRSVLATYINGKLIYSRTSAWSTANVPGQKLIFSSFNSII